MVVVADASPVCYLILIGEIEVLPKLFTQVLLPVEGLGELVDQGAPSLVRAWAGHRRGSRSVFRQRATGAALMTGWIASTRENERRSSWPNRPMLPSFSWMRNQLAASRRREV